MNPRWDNAETLPKYRIGLMGWLRVVVRGLALSTVIFTGLFVLLMLRLVERPLFGQGRPVTPHITQSVCRTAFWIIGLRRRKVGVAMQHPGAVVANHASWLDIFSLNASQRIYFVAKSEVAGWPGIGWLARATGTVFIERNPKRAREQTEIFQQRLLHDHRLLFFPEGTSTDGQQVLPFKTTLFQAFVAPELRDVIWIQPVSVTYSTPDGSDDRFYGWWGDMTFGAHLLATLAAKDHGKVITRYHPPLKVSEFVDRKALALACENLVRQGHRTDLANN
jgi:1-acyl-sn-glycerol-3-phosphate acyltransferase